VGARFIPQHGVGEKGLPDSFTPGKMKSDSDDIDPATTKNIKWIAKLGTQAYGNPVIANGRVYVGTNNQSPRMRKWWGTRAS